MVSFRNLQDEAGSTVPNFLKYWGTRDSHSEDSYSSLVWTRQRDKRQSSFYKKIAMNEVDASEFKVCVSD